MKEKTSVSPRKRIGRPLTWEDVREAAKAGDAAFEEWSRTGKLPGAK